MYQLESPILMQNQYETLLKETTFKHIHLSLKIDTTLRDAVAKFRQSVIEATNEGVHIIILDDECEGKVIPSLMATSIAHEVLVKMGKRLEVRLILKCGDARLPIHFAMLLAYGGDFIYPYFCYHVITKM